MLKDFLQNEVEKMLFKHYTNYHNSIYAYFLSKINVSKMYLPCLEIPITTFCTLCCEKCANLIQYYKDPYHVSCKKVIHNIEEICQSVHGIDCIRILGGEPLLVPQLGKILQYIKNQKKIQNIVIVTNGTLLFSDECIEIMKSSNKFKVAISNYRYNSNRMSSLEKQLKSEGIYYVLNDISWKDKANVSCRNKKQDDMQKSFKKCTNRFFSLLNGELHICPRSAHGTDLNIVPKRNEDYICLSDYYNNPKGLCLAIKELLCRPYIAACNYCDEDRAEELFTVISGKQCSKIEALEILENMVACKKVCERER